MQTGIIQKTHHLHLEETARQLLICDEQFHDAVNDVFVEYVLERFKSGKEDKVIQALAQQPTRFFEIVRSAAQRNVMLPLLLIAKYCPAELVIRKTRAYVYKYRAEINLFNKTKRKAFVQELKEILEDRCREEKSIRGKSEKKRIEVTGFSKELINVIDAADKNGGKIKLYIIAICAVALVLVGILAAVFLFGSGENEKDDTQESTGVEDSNSTDESQPSEPDESQPTEPGATDPTEPGATGPTEPGATDPTEPGATGPTEPGATDPTEPGTTEPTTPNETPSGDSDNTPTGNPDTNVA